MDVRQFIIDGEQIDVKDVEARDNIGDLSELETTAKDSLVSAINELENAPTGIHDYNELDNQPSINGVTLVGNKTTAELNIDVGIGRYINLPDKPSINNVTLVGNIDSSDLNIEYDDLSNRPVESGNVDMDSIVNPLPPIATEERVLFDERGTEYTVGWYVNSSAKRKPLYQKTVNTGSLPDNASKQVAHGISNIEFVADFKGIIKNTSGNGIYSNVPLVSDMYPDINTQITIDVTNITLSCRKNNNGSSGWTQSYITMFYTKTTDEWEDIPS